MNKKAAVIDGQEEAVQRKSLLAEILRRYFRNKPALFGTIFIIFLVIVALFANLICDYQAMAIKQNPDIRLQAPSSAHLFGTDGLGRDIFARMIHGAKISLGVSFIVVLFSSTLGAFLGSLIALVGGKIDNLVMRCIDVFTCIPGMLLTLALVASLGPGIRNLMIAISINMTIGFIRVIRAAVLSVVNQDYIEAARSYGTKTIRLVWHFVLPNAIGLLIVQAAMSVAGTILSIAGLSFLGMGIESPTPEWGAMLSEGRAFMRTFPYLILFPGLAIGLTTLSLNLMGDGLRDALDPKLRD